MLVFTVTMTMQVSSGVEMGECGKSLFFRSGQYSHKINVLSAVHNCG
jgi:hypothetical protein